MKHLIHNLRIKKGFTLVELLIVVAIIGILATLLMANFVGVRQRARDAERKADLRQIQSALEFYRSDQGSYPATLASCGAAITGGSPANTYMQKIPCDPLGSGGYNSGNYYFSSTGTVYTIGACLENSADTQGAAKPSGAPAGCTSNLFYVVTNP